MSEINLNFFVIFKYLKTRRKPIILLSFLMVLYFLYICSDRSLIPKSVSKSKSDANNSKTSYLLPNLIYRQILMNTSHINTISPQNLTSLMKTSKTFITRNFETLLQIETQSNRKKRLDYFCQKYGLKHRILTIWRKSSNAYKGRHRYCPTKSCPILVDQKHKFMFCFVQKIASTSVKKLFSVLNENQMLLNESRISNITAFHLRANDVMSRISPMYYSSNENKKYFKAIFTRHPFLRLVSAFKDKAEKNRTEEPFFYNKYWDRIMRLERGNQSVTNDSKPLFKEFVKLILISKINEYDEHWAPIWTRCEPCYVEYDFIGKLETPRDFQLMQSHIKPELKNKEMIWENKNQNKSNDSIKSETKKYFLQISAEEIIALYKIYFLDFKLFGYTIEEIFR